jgi:hypothetical protein
VTLIVALISFCVAALLMVVVVLDRRRYNRNHAGDSAIDAAVRSAPPRAILTMEILYIAITGVWLVVGIANGYTKVAWLLAISLPIMLFVVWKQLRR